MNRAVPATYVFIVSTPVLADRYKKLILHVVRAKVAKPNGNPELSPPDPDDFSGANATNERVYSEIPNIPALMVECEAAWTPLADRLRWSVAPIPDAAESWTNQVPHAAITHEGRGRISMAKFEGMPQNNNGFGLKKVDLWFDFDTAIKASANIEVFFPRDGNKHPGNTGKLPEFRTPNWFYYWASDKGGPLTHRTAGTSTLGPITIFWLYDPNLTIHGKIDGVVGGTNFVITLGPSATSTQNHDFVSPKISFPAKGGGAMLEFPEGHISTSFVRANNWEGIDCVEKVIQHEIVHATIMNNWSPNGPWWDGALFQDDDLDHLPTSHENDFGTDWNKNRTFDFYLGGNDNEIRCEIDSGNPIIPASGDWASPGKQKQYGR